MQFFFRKFPLKVDEYDTSQTYDSTIHILTEEMPFRTGKMQLLICPSHSIYFKLISKLSETDDE